MKNKYETDGDITRVYITTKGVEYVVLIDTEDIELARTYPWRIHVYNAKLYARANTSRPGIHFVKCRMHRLIVNAPEGMMVDHINGDTLDNRKSNLRLCTREQNAWNSPGRGGSSVYKGVSKTKSGKWAAQIKANKEAHYLGCFNNEVEAARAYDEAAKKLHREFAHLNFPEEFSEELSA